MEIVKDVARMDQIISELLDMYNRECSRLYYSRSGLCCTFCGCERSCTWRPGPCGSSTLCNSCGILYTTSGNRQRRIELVLRDSRALWVRLKEDGWTWEVDHEADSKDERISEWMNHEYAKNIVQVPKKRLKL